MLSPDPVTQAPENGQNYNRYTYAYNNPLRYSDPSGFVTDPATITAEAALLEFAKNTLINSAFAFIGDKIFGGLFGGNSCDRTCQLRDTAYKWCLSLNSCTEELAATANGKPRVVAASLFQASVTAAIGDNVRAGNLVSQPGVVGVTDPNFPGFKEDDIFLTAGDAQKVFKFFFGKEGKIKKDDMTLDDRAFAQFLLLSGIEYTATGIMGMLEIGEKLSGKGFEGMGKKAAAKTVTKSIMEATVRQIQKGRVAWPVQVALRSAYGQEYRNRLNPNIGAGQTFIVSD